MSFFDIFLSLSFSEVQTLNLSLNLISSQIIAYDTDDLQNDARFLSELFQCPKFCFLSFQQKKTNFKDEHPLQDCQPDGRRV